MEEFFAALWEEYQGIIIGAIVGLTIACFRPIKQWIIKGRKQTEQENWDSHAGKIQQQISEMKKSDEKVIELLNDIKTTSENNKTALESSIQSLKSEHDEYFKDVYRRDLIVDGKKFLEAKYITPQQKADYDNRYRKYRNLGGNGVVEIWYKKICALPVRSDMPKVDDEE